MSWGKLFSNEPIAWFQSSKATSPRRIEYADWLRVRFAHIATAPLGERHKRLWEWFEALEPGIKPPARVEVWPRGGAKSSTGELGCAYLAERMTRKFVLYVSGTQSQADLHVQAVGSLLEQMGVSRAVSKYGASKGWRRDQLRTNSGFNVAAYGLDTASRGVKIDNYRPDLIILDDIDALTDTAETVAKKEQSITSSVIPTGGPDCAVLFLQNLIHEDGIVARLVDGRAQFLLHREVPRVEPAVENLVTEIVTDEDGLGAYRIVSGRATWEGQNLSVCESQINEWGLPSFLREAQHEVKGAGGYFFDSDKFSVVDEAPILERVCLAWDLAGTQGGGDYTAAVLMGLASSGLVYVLQVIRGQWSSEKIRAKILANADRIKDRFPAYTVHIPQDPGQAGKDQAEQLRRLLAAYSVRIEPVSGKKATRASGWAEKVNLGNVRLLKGAWNHDYIQEHRRFAEDESHAHDDQVDASADAYNEIEPRFEVKQRQTVKSHESYHHVTRTVRPKLGPDGDEEDEEEDA